MVRSNLTDDSDFESLCRRLSRNNVSRSQFLTFLHATQPDTINALWVAADLDTREGTTFVDVVDFCFNCVLFMEREKEARVAFCATVPPF